ncbi:acyltransferase [Longispora sp. K20-0274]|uniref:acyltransferase family protein n=1 Tax=Longispora sp. K20-0274 TaxID=3088255 RepID=UPI00399C2771
MPPPPAIPLPSLTGLRWIAALLVFGLHVHTVEYFARNSGAGLVVHWLFGAGATGVSFFFVLSGFVLAWSAREHDRPFAFWHRRFARVYPLHAVTALAALLLGWLLLPRSLPSSAALVANALLVHPWNTAIGYSQSLNPVSWSLACEALFYALFPALFWLVRRLGPRGAWWVAGVSLAATVTVPFLVTDHLTRYFPLVRLPEFALGVALACLVRAGRWAGPGMGVALVVLAAGYALTAWVPDQFRFAACTVPGFALVITAAAGGDLTGARSVWRHPVAVRLGELSFAFYMIHILVIRTGEALFASHPRLGSVAGAAVAAAAFAVALALSWALYAGVECPSRRLLLTPWRRPAPARAAVAPATSDSVLARSRPGRIPRQPRPRTDRRRTDPGTDRVPTTRR